jgi:hypothetical protein
LSYDREESLDRGAAGSSGEPAHAEEVLRLVETHSGVSDVLGSTRGIERLTDVVAQRLEGGRAGTRFPLLRVLLRRGAVSAQECDALAREVVRLRVALASVALDAPDARRTSDPALDAAAPLSTPAASPAGAPKAPAPRTLAETYARALSVVEHVARLGGASRRGVRVEVGPDLPTSTRARLAF